MNPIYKSSIVILALAQSLIGTLNAQETIAEWTFSTPETGTYLEPSTVGPHVTASTLKTTAGLTDPGGTGQVGGKQNWGNPAPLFRVRTDSVPMHTSGGLGSYVEFTVQAKDGYLLSLDKLTFDYGVNNKSVYGFVLVRSDADNFSSDILLPQAFNNEVENATPAWKTASIDLAQLAGMSATKERTFRIYFRTNNRTSSRFLDLDSIKLTGSTSTGS